MSYFYLLLFIVLFFVSDIAIISRLLNKYGHWFGACTRNIHGLVNIVIIHFIFGSCVGVSQNTLVHV